ncbi:hypothetical protein PENSTE_c002G08895 [Penicillium steckii]|uniref:Uncharacterized protein n=1 Tax=Penicillium steckii TaxID=303698 RepID=A0A1V6TU07_9EURO|nr:hypothetical protein PENSTE_c002G08895 [Penicillium steckii]
MLQLGNFVKLPVEVRFLIWDELFSAIEKMPKSEKEPSAKLLSILRCSSSLYEEVSPQLYHGLKHIIYVNSVYHRSYFVKAVVSSKKINCMRKLKDRAALRSHIMRFPFSKIEELHIIISSPKQDIGHAISLWLKVNGIVLVLANLKCCLKLRISLTEGWIRNKQPGAQGFRFAGADHYIYDYDLAILPFTGSGLSGWSFDMPHTLLRQISEEPSDRPNSLLHYIHKRGIKITGSSCPMADAWMAKTRCLLDIILDETSGTMLEQLRRDRYMNWFSADGISTVCYEQQFLKDLERHHEDLLRYDRYCQRLVNRRFPKGHKATGSLNTEIFHKSFDKTPLDNISADRFTSRGTYRRSTLVGFQRKRAVL